MASGADIPGRFDIVIDSVGYCFYRGTDEVADYSYSPTFVERTNVSGDYGDNQQDFWLTQSQRDWSLGEQQRYFRQDDGQRQYWSGNNIDVSAPGQVKLAPSLSSLTFAAVVRAGARETFTQNVFVVSSTHLYRVAVDGTITDVGAHGLGAAPSWHGMAVDGSRNYISTTTTGTVGVRKWDGRTDTFSTFSADGADALAFVNNTLYGFRKTDGDLVRWDSAGTITSVFTFKDADGNAYAPNEVVLHPYGGKLLLLFNYGQEAAELWLYDGIAPSRLAVFPENFIANDIDVMYGVIYVSGSFVKAADGTNSYTRPAVLFLVGTTYGLLWQANDYRTTSIVTGNSGPGPHPSLGTAGGRLVFNDDTTGGVKAYNPSTGGVSTIGSYTVSGDSTRFMSTPAMFVHTRNQTTGYYFPNPASYPSSGYVVSSLIDFNSGLEKLFRGVIIEWEAASDGDGGSVDVAYQLESVDGSYTTLSTDVTSGDEILFADDTSGRRISIKVTLNKGTSTSGPTLKKMSVRAAPVLQRFQRNQYVLDCSGRDGKNHVVRRDNTTESNDGLTLATALRTAKAATTPTTISDENGSFTGIIEELHLRAVRPQEYVANVTVREV